MNLCSKEIKDKAANALRCIINEGKEENFQFIKDCLSHEDRRIRVLAQWGCERLGVLRS